MSNHSVRNFLLLPSLNLPFSGLNSLPLSCCKHPVFTGTHLSAAVPCGLTQQETKVTTFGCENLNAEFHGKEKTWFFLEQKAQTSLAEQLVHWETKLPCATVQWLLFSVPPNSCPSCDFQSSLTRTPGGGTSKQSKEQSSKHIFFFVSFLSLNM